MGSRMAGRLDGGSLVLMEQEVIEEPISKLARVLVMSESGIRAYRASCGTECVSQSRWGEIVVEVCLKENCRAVSAGPVGNLKLLS